MKIIRAEKTAAAGIAAARAYVYSEPEPAPERKNITKEEIPAETAAFEKAKEQVLRELGRLAAEDDFFAGHLKIAEDFTLSDSVISKIKTEKKNAQAALAETIDEFAQMFASMDDAYMKEREADVRDTGKRFMGALKGAAASVPQMPQEEVIVAAENLYPSDIVRFDPKSIKGIITEKGSAVSHAAILAAGRGIPVLTGVKGILQKLGEGSTVCMDAGEGTVIIDPDGQTLEEYRKKIATESDRKKALELLRRKEPVTRSGRRILLCVNAGSTEEVCCSAGMNLDGVGLFRSEFLYMENDHFPTEEEQFQAYKKAVLCCQGELTVRTLDIGGDKQLPYFKMEKEKNPAMGWRGIRISLDQKEIFKTQLRALLRAGAFGKLRIMFPMLTSCEEFREARAVTEECKRELERENIPYGRNVPTGMMAETPASVLLADEFAEEADFFSIGTNDLTQYLLAADRENEKTAGRYDHFHPAVIRAVERIIRAGQRAGIRVCMCGEMAGDEAAVPMLLKMGLDEFSVPAARADAVRKQILEFDKQA